MTLAILLSGQGAQHPAMFDLTADRPEARPVFAAAADRLGDDPRELVRRPGADLHGNRTGQILCVTAALAGWAVIGGAVPPRSIVAGYSVGDLAAWGPAGRMEPRTVIALAARRAEEMDRAAGADQGLAGIRGLPLSRIAALAERHGLHLAIRNAADSAVVGGAGSSLDEVCAEALGMGALRARRLDVRVPSHTPALAPATEALRAILREAPATAPPTGAPRLISGLDGSPVLAPRVGLEKLARQVSETIDWAACLAACEEHGATTWLELGPGRALVRMVESRAPGGRVRSAEDFSTPEGLLDWLARDAA